MVDIAALKAANTRRWVAAKLTRDFAPAARLVASNAKQRYITVSRKTGVPWWFIAVVHEREASQNWNTQLGQGDPLDKVSIHVPKGRGPFVSWEEGAIDALVNCAPFAARNTDWSVGGALTMLEQYNGTGYAARGLPSPYIWSGTDQYVKGKYIADGKFDPEAVDKQLGCAGLLKTMMGLDASIAFAGEQPAAPVRPKPVEVPKTPPVPKPVPAPPQGNWLANLFTALLSIFKRR